MRLPESLGMWLLSLTGHTNSSKIFPFSAMDANMLQIKNILTISQHLEIDDLTGRLTTDENRALFDELPAFPQLQYKLRLLLRTMCRVPVADIFMAHNNMAFSLFCLDRNLSQIFKKQQRHILY
jgi:hypothetical protein